MEDFMKEYEEYKTLSPFWGWVVLIVFSFLLITYGMFANMFILEPKEREWDFGSMPIVPGESVYTTHEPGNNGTKPQMSTLPGAYKYQKLPPDTSESFSGECTK